MLETMGPMPPPGAYHGTRGSAHKGYTEPHGQTAPTDCSTAPGHLSTQGSEHVAGSLSFPIPETCHPSASCRGSMGPNPHHRTADSTSNRPAQLIDSPRSQGFLLPAELLCSIPAHLCQQHRLARRHTRDLFLLAPFPTSLTNPW